MIAFDLPAWIVLPYLFVMGASIGSFLSVCVYRLPRAGGRLIDGLRAISHPPSSCPKCGTRIKLRDNIPILGWLLLGGRCRSCRAKISIRYPLFEMANGLLWVLLYLIEVPPQRMATVSDSLLATQYGPTRSENWLHPDALIHLRYGFHLLLMELLLVASIVDADTKTIPKILTDPWIAVGIALSAFGGLYLVPLTYRPEGILQDASLFWSLVVDSPMPDWLAACFDGPPTPDWISGSPNSQLHGLAVSIVGAIAGAVPILFLRIAGRRIYGREAMGAGDVYLMAMVGAFLGWQPTLTAIVLAAFIACGFFVVMAVVGVQAEIPFGPFLSAGAAVVLFGWPWVFRRIEAFFALGPLLLPLLAVLAVAFVVLAVLMRLVLHPLLCLIPGYRDQWYGTESTWTAADQNQFFAGSRIDEDRTLSQRPDWNGDAVSSGFSGEHAWRDE